MPRLNCGGSDVRKLGIIGGTSWSSTALYYEHINRGIAQRLGGLAQRAARSSKASTSRPSPRWSCRATGMASRGVTLEAAKRLEAAGAEGVIITSNTGPQGL